MKTAKMIVSLVLLQAGQLWASTSTIERKANYEISDLQGKIRGMHILGNELNGKPTGGSLTLVKGEKENEECFSAFIKGEFPRSGYRASGIHACGPVGGDAYYGKEEKVYLFGDEPFFVDQDIIEVTWSDEQALHIDKIGIRTKRTYNKKQYFQAFGMGVVDFLSFGGTRILWGNMRDTLTQDLIHGFESYASDVTAENLSPVLPHTESEGV